MKNELLDYLLNKREKSARFKQIHNNLKIHHENIKKSFHVTHKHAKKLLHKHKVLLGSLRHGAVKAAAGAALATSLFVSPAHTAPVPTNNAASVPEPSKTSLMIGPQNPEKVTYNKDQFAEQIKNIMANSGKEGKLSDTQLAQIQKIVKDQFGIDVSRTTDSGFSLLHNYGYAGAEQHVPTKPGDTAANHVSKEEPLAILTGLTSGRAAYGYINPKREKYYFTAQTFRSPNFGTSASKGLEGQPYLVMQMPTPENGNSFFIALMPLEEAGPGVSTGKVFGLPPEAWYFAGPQAGRSRKTQIIALPINGQSFNDDQWGPMEVK